MNHKDIWGKSIASKKKSKYKGLEQDVIADMTSSRLWRWDFPGESNVITRSLLIERQKIPGTEGNVKMEARG